MRRSRDRGGAAPRWAVFVFLAFSLRQSVAFLAPSRPYTVCRGQNHILPVCFAKKTQKYEDEPPRQQEAKQQDDICESVKAAFAYVHDTIRDAFKSLTELSLKDYQWRSSIFKNNEADRLMEQSLARMRGEDASYLRPMDANDEKIGPLVSKLFHTCSIL